MDEKKPTYLDMLAIFRMARDTRAIGKDAILLYFILLDKLNTLNFPEWLTLPNSILQGMTGISETALIRARNELIQKGYIEYKKGSRGQAPGYKNILANSKSNSPTLNFDGQMCAKPTTKCKSNVSYPDGQMSANCATYIDKTRQDKIRQDNKKEKDKKESVSPQGTPSARKNGGYDEILSVVDDEDLKNLYYEFIKMRKLIKSPMTDRALTTLIDKVNTLEPSSIERQKKLLENSIVNNWKSVYPLKDNESKGSNIKSSKFNNYTSESKTDYAEMEEQILDSMLDGDYE